MKPRINYTGPSTLMGGGGGRPAPQHRGLPLPGLSNRKPVEAGRRAMELPVETYCGGQAQGRPVRQPVSESPPPPPAFVFLTLFPRVQDVQRQKPKPVPACRCAQPIVRVSGFPEASLAGFRPCTARPCFRYSIRDAEENGIGSLPPWKGLAFWVLFVGMKTWGCAGRMMGKQRKGGRPVGRGGWWNRADARSPGSPLHGAPAAPSPGHVGCRLLGRFLSRKTRVCKARARCLGAGRCQRTCDAHGKRDRKGQKGIAGRAFSTHSHGSGGCWVATATP